MNMSCVPIVDTRSHFQAHTLLLFQKLFRGASLQRTAIGILHLYPLFVLDLKKPKSSPSSSVPAENQIVLGLPAAVRKISENNNPHRRYAFWPEHPLGELAKVCTQNAPTTTQKGAPCSGP